LGAIERRRRWSQDDKARIVEETLAQGEGDGVGAAMALQASLVSTCADRHGPPSGRACFAPVQMWLRR